MSNIKSLADLINATDPKNRPTTGNPTWKLFFPFYKADVDTVTTVRFLPDLDTDNPLAFYVENYYHELEVDGRKTRYPCLKHMHNKPCPLCAKSEKFYNKKSPDHDEKLGKTFYRKKSYIGQVLVIESPVEYEVEPLVKLIEFGPQIMDQMKAGWKSGDLENLPYLLKGGHNFRIRKTKKGENNSYSTSGYQAKPTDIDDEIIEAMTLYNLADYREKEIDSSVLEAALLSWETMQHLGVSTQNTSISTSNDGVVTKSESPSVATGLTGLAALQARARAAEEARRALGE